jgi:uncharacterized membrane protein YagU involved in acid resistance
LTNPDRNSRYLSIIRIVTTVLGAIAAVMAWLGWLALAPALGLPALATAAMVNRDVASDKNADFWLGWLILLLGLAAAVAFYLLVTGGFVKPRIWLGLLYGLVLWLVAGAVVMPLLAWGAPAAPPPPPLPPGTPPPPQAPDPMDASFMMLDFSNWAPVSAAVGWLLFGAILGVTSVRSARGEAV